MQLFDTNKDEIKIITPVSWEEYTYYLENRESKARISYLDGVIQFVSPGYNHEKSKEIIAILIIAYCEHFNIEYYPMGSTTLRQEDKSVGKEPDTSYALGTEKDIPDLAVEVIFTNANPDKDLEQYRRLRVQEVWFWINDDLEAYTLVKDKYLKLEKFSLMLPQLKLELISEGINQGLNQSPLITKKEFIASLP